MGKRLSRQVEKRQALSEDSLLVGIDIGSAFHAIVLMNKAGEILKEYPKIYESRKGFEYLLSEIRKAQGVHGLKGVHVGFEPTGHYWKNLMYYLDGKGCEVHFIRTTAVKYQREIDESSPSKTDIKDARIIANLLREGKYLDSKLQYGVYKELRDLGKLRARVVKMKGAMVNRLKMILNNYFPELAEYFWATEAVGLWRLMEKAPFPKDVLELGVKKLEKLLPAQGSRKMSIREKSEKIYEAAEKSIGLEVSETEYFNLKICLENLELYHREMAKIKKEMERLLKQTEYGEIMLSISGVGPVTAGTFLGELGDPRNFSNYKQIVKFMGIDPKENSSGKTQSMYKISKKGRYLMRTMIYYMTLRVIYRDEYFKKLYRKRLEEKTIFGRHLLKKQAVFAIAIKLVRVIFAMLRDKSLYQEQMNKYDFEYRLAA